MHADPSRVENLAQGSSCQLKFVHVCTLFALATLGDTAPIGWFLSVPFQPKIIEKLVGSGNTNIVPLTSCLTGLESAV